MLDLLIKDGLILDGSGNPGFYGAIGLEGDRLSVFRGDPASIETRRTINAAGKVVCPGFIDVHAHSGLMILADPKHEAKVHQGVTTELIGVDGNSYAPFNTQQDLKDFICLNSGLDGDPTLPGTWSSVAEYLSMFDRKVAVNIAYILGNSALRINAVGWNNRPATAPEIANMKAQLRESLEEGAFGMSTGLDYPPGSFADTNELVELSTEAARLGGIYHTHVRYKLGDRYLDPFREAIDIGRRSRVPVHITHLFRFRTAAGGARPILEFVDQERDKGLDITFDMFPYYRGGSRIVMILPDWTHDGGPEKVKEVLRSPEAREQLRQEVRPYAGAGWGSVWLTYFKQPQNRHLDGLSVAEIADRLNKHPVDAICDLLLEEDLRVSWTSDTVDDGTLSEFIAHPVYMVGSDAVLLGDYPPQSTYGAFPAILSELVREERKIPLQEAIRKMTSSPAQRLGLPDRGLLQNGMKADIVVFNPQTIRANSTRHKPKQLSTGVEYVIVNGTIVIENGQHTGALPGRSLRRGAPA